MFEFFVSVSLVSIAISLFVLAMIRLNKGRHSVSSTPDNSNPNEQWRPPKSEEEARLFKKTIDERLRRR